MIRQVLIVSSALLLGACTGGGISSRSQVSSLECAPYARAATGIALYGDAADWWDRAEGRYARLSSPAPGGVLVFQRSGRLPHGHVSVVRAQVSPREIRVDQANWVHHRLTTNEPVIDVSDANDWSRVRVWWSPSGAMGSGAYATYGFVALAMAFGVHPP